jgi:hypothetical protein
MGLTAVFRITCPCPRADTIPLQAMDRAFAIGAHCFEF